MSFYRAIPTTDKATVLGNPYKITVDFLGSRTNCLVSHKERGCHLSQDLGMDILYHDAPEGLPKHLWMIYWDGK